MNPGNKMRVNKFVLDNNIWVSYFITKKEQRLLEIIKPISKKSTRS
jgi:hypothetical protein